MAKTKTKNLPFFIRHKETMKKLMVLMVVIEASFLYIQAYKIYKDKSAEDISKLSYWVLLAVNILWFFYGKYIVCDMPVQISAVLYTIGSILVLAACYKYN